MPPEIASLEGEHCEVFEQVTMRHSPHVRIPVSLQVGLSHLRILSVRTDQSCVRPVSDKQH